MGWTTWGEPLSGIEQPTAIEIADGVRKGELSAREVVDDYLGRIDAGNGALNAFVQSMAPPADWRDKMREHRGERATLTTPERLDRMKARLADRQVQFARRADATMRFYSQLSPSQKKAFDAMRPMGGRGGKGGKGGGHRGGGHG